MRTICMSVFLAVLSAGVVYGQTEAATQAVGPRPLEIASRTAAAPGVTVVRLSNGLTVIVAESHIAPVVNVAARVRTGSMYEGKYLGAGISHLLEHLVAKGAAHDGELAKPARQTRDRVDEIGGQSNAYTSTDVTTYYISAASGKTDDCIDLIADWMARADITRADFQREHGVVQRELEMGLDNPGRVMWYAHARNLFGHHPAAVPVIGNLAPLAALTYQDVLDYHRLKYVPQNMVFTVCGDVDTAKALDRVRRAFAGFEPGRDTDQSLPPVAPVAGTRRATVTSTSVTQTVANISFQTIPLVHEDLYALDVLSYILSNGESSRLVRNVQRRDGLVTSIGTSSWTPDWGKGSFTVHYRCEPDKADPAEAAIGAELKQVAAEGVTAEELARAKRQKTADYVYSQQTVESQADTLASDYLSTGDVGFSRMYTDRIQKVTAEQVHAAARKYFHFEAMVITRMIPAGAEAAVAAGGEEAAQGRTKFLKLANGLRVVLHSAPSAGLVSTALVTRGGLTVESADTNGLGTLMTALSTQGAGKRSAEEIAALFDEAGGGINGSCGNNTFYWRSTVLADSFERTLPVFADVALRPTYPRKELDILRPILLAGIRRTEESWFGQLNKRFRKDFFGDLPYSMLSSGSEEVVSAATPAEIAAYHKRHVVAGASVLAVYGQFDVDAAEKSIRELFAAMPAGDAPLPEGAPRQVPAGGELHVHPTELKGAAVMVGVPGMRIDNEEDRAAVDVLDTIISGYSLPRGWLHEELRGRKLVYVVHATNWVGLLPGTFMTYAQCEPKNAKVVADVIADKYRQTLTHEYTDEEIRTAVHIILTVELLENQSMSSLAMQAALDEAYGFGYDYRKTLEKRLGAVTPGELKRVAKEYFSGGYVTTAVTPEPKVFEQDEK